jgi:hypothetical protein
VPPVEVPPVEVPPVEVPPVEVPPVEVPPVEVPPVARPPAETPPPVALLAPPVPGSVSAPPTFAERPASRVVPPHAVPASATSSAARKPSGDVRSFMHARGSKPRAPGAATFSGARFVGADDANLYLVWDTDQPVGAVFARVDETSGAKATAATLQNVSTPFYPQLSGDSIYFVDSTIGATIDTNTYGFLKAGANVTPTLLWTGNLMTDACNLGIGGLTATPTKLVCGLFGVESHARTGGPGAVVVPEDLTVRANEVVASDAENIYVNTPPTSATAVGSLQRVASSGGAITPIACDVRNLENHMADGTFPIQNEYEVIVGGNQLYWIEKNLATSDTTWTIRHAPK